MDMALKVLQAFLAVAIFFVVGLAINIANASEINTNNYFETVSKTIIESNYNEDVIDNLIEAAAEEGHQLTVEVYSNGQAGAKKCADIQLKYKYEIGFFGLSIDREKQKVL